MGETLLRSTIRVIFFVLFYYCTSISLTFFNKAVFQELRLALTLTLIQLCVKFLIVSGVRGCLQQLKCGRSRNKDEQPWIGMVVGWSAYARSVALPAVASALDIGLSNWSLEYITVSLYTMSKTSVIIFILISTLALRLETFRCSFIAIVLLIAIGLFLLTFEASKFHLGGFLLVLAASVMGGVRWTLYQQVLQRSKLGLQNPLDLIYHVQPWMILGLLPMMAIVEGSSMAGSRWFFNFHDWSDVAHTATLVLCGAALAVLLEVSEYLLVLFTSGLTLSVAAVPKDICQLLLAAKLRGDELNLVNFVGLVACLTGLVLHVWTKVRQAAMETLLHQAKSQESLRDGCAELEQPLLAEELAGGSVARSGWESLDDGDSLELSPLTRRPAATESSA